MTIDPAFRKQVKEVLEHLYDTAYLETHPFTLALITSQTSSRATRAQKLRSIVKDAIETLRPHDGSPSSSPEWRCYRALRFRFVQGMNMGQVESELGISLRQLQREFHKGLDAVAALLWEQRTGIPQASSESNEMAEPDDVQDLQEELDQWVFDRHPSEVFVLVEDVLWMLNPLIDEAGTRIEIDLPDSLPLILVDATLTRQALFKLMRLMLQKPPESTQETPGSEPETPNSVTESSITQSVTITGRRTGAAVEVQMRFQQSGAPGMDTNNVDWRIAALLLERQGGAIRLDSSSDGVSAHILLPGTEQRVVLVVDDNPAIHQLFERYLAPSRYAVQHAYSGSEALQMVENRPPDIITLDVMMAAMDGWQVLRALKNSLRTANIPVIVCSVLREPELAYSLGAQAYLKKPVERLQLQEELERLLRDASSPSAGLPKAFPDN